MLRLIIISALGVLLAISLNSCCTGCDCQGKGLFVDLEKCIEDLPFDGLHTFSQLDREIPVGFSDRNGLIETEDEGELLFGGTSRDSNMLVVLIDKEGKISDSDVTQLDSLPKGMIHQIIKGHKEGEYVTIGSTTDGDMFVLKIDKKAKVLFYKKFKQFFNAPGSPYYGPGNVEKLVGFAITQTANQGFALTGYYKQNLANNRLFALRLDDTEGDLDVVWLKTYFNNTPTYGMSIQEANNKDLIISGYRSSKLSIFKLNEDGDASWIKSFAESIQGHGNNVFMNSEGKAITVGTYNRSIGNDIYITEVNTSSSLEDANGFFGLEETNKNEFGYFIKPTINTSEYVVLGKNHSKNLYLFKVYKGSDGKYRKCDLDVTDELDYCFERADYPSYPSEIPVDMFQLRHTDNNEGYAIGTIVSNNNEDYFLRIIKTDAVGAYF